jgi:hypothetical protein
MLLRAIDKRELVLGMAIIVLNLIDAFFTLRHVSHGAEELNPLMDVLLSTSSGRFVVVKHLLVSLCVLGILLRSREKLARFALGLATFLFAGLAIYHTALLIFVQ